MTESSTERTLDEVLDELNDLQLKFVLARVNARFDHQAAQAAGIHGKTPIRWRKKGVPIDEAIRLMRINAIQSAQEAIKAAAVLAVDTIIDEMTTKGPERVRAALAVLDRVGMPATNRLEGSIEAAGVMIVLDDGQAD